MPKPAWVIEEQLKARHKRVNDAVRLFRPVSRGSVGRAGTPAWAMVSDIAVLLLDMPDAEWDRLVGLRRIEASIRRNAKHQIKPGAEKPSQRKPGETRGMRKRGETLEGLRAARDAYQQAQGDGRALEASGDADPPQPLSEPGDGHGP